MFTQLLDQVGTYVHTNPWMAVVAVFFGGVLTATAPCVLIMVPLMMGFVAGAREQKPGPLRAFGYSMVFVAGLSLTFVVMGMVAALAGKLYGNVSQVWSWVVAAVCVVMGLHMAGILPLRLPAPMQLQPKTRGVIGALLLGLLFGVVSAPCAAPVLVVILTYLAGSGASVPYGGFLLFVYSLGHSALLIAAGTSMGVARKLVESKRITRATDIMRRVAGGLIVAVGAYFVYAALK